MLMMHLCEIEEALEIKTEMIIISTDVSHPKMIELKNKYCTRVFDIGIAEQSAVGIASGLSIKGLYPFIYGPASFITTRAFEQIKNNISLNQLEAVIVGFGSGLSWTAYGPTHCSVDDFNLMNLLPNIKVWTPFSKKSCRQITKYIISNKGAHYLCIGESSFESDISLSDNDLQNGFFHRRVDTSRILLVTTGALVSYYDEKFTIRSERINTLIVFGNFIDNESFAECISTYDNILIAEEKFASGGLGNKILSIINDNSYSITVNTKFVSAQYGIEDNFSSEIERLDLSFEKIYSTISNWRCL